MRKLFDVIIVGAGPAGSVAALKLAKAGLQVALLERGMFPGSKNMFGGLLHNSPILKEIFPDFYRQAPLERYVHKKTLAVVTPESSVNMTLETENFNRIPHNGYTVMRPIFDNWLAEQAVKEGASLICNCTAENLIKQDNKITGVTVKGRDGDLRANLVIAADGVLSFMAEKAGLRREIPPERMGLGVKLLLGLPEEIINERFGLVRDEGADYSFLGMAGDLRGGGFLYTNIDSLSIGMVVHLGSLKASGKTPYDILNSALQQPQIKKLVKGGVTLEYSAHLVPEGGIKGIPGLFTDGMMVIGDAAGLCYTNGINLEGINLAMTSGSIAADCAVEAVKAKDFSASMLSMYRKKLEASSVVKDMKTFGNAVKMMHIDRLFQVYPGLACDILEKVYRVDGMPRDKILKLIRKEAMKKVNLKDLLADVIRIKRGLL